MKSLRLNQLGMVLPLLAIGIVLVITAGVCSFVFIKQKDKVVSSTTAKSSATVQTEQNKVTTTQAASATKQQDLTKLPLGDGKISTSPKKGYVYSCQSSFMGGGAEHAGSWIVGSMWNLETKPHVEGDIQWSAAKINISQNGNQRNISGNGLPVQTATGIFPIQVGTTAYQYDRNPNSIKAQTVYYSLPIDPVTTTPSCVGMGVIGYMTNGVALFNALDNAGRDAVAHEIQDLCDGHPERNGTYHYHGLSGCLAKTEGNNQLLGYALDGFGIFSNKDANGNVITSEDLDECHGTTSQIMWDGKMVNMYHYVLTNDYPYSVGCFRGTPVKMQR